MVKGLEVVVVVVLVLGEYDGGFVGAEETVEDWR